MRRSAARDVRAAIADAGRRAVTPLALERDVVRHLTRVVPFDRWCGLTIDPATGHPTGGYHDEGLPVVRMPRLLEIENAATPDFLALSTLARPPARVRTLAEATGGDLRRSARFRDVLEPSGVRHEVRVPLRCGGGTWGVLALFRGSDERDFSPAETGLLASVAPVVGEGLRRTVVLGQSPARSDDGPGLLLCTVAEQVTVDSATGSARRRLAELDDGTTGGVPYAIASLAHSARHDPAAGPRRARMRTRTGEWITVHAERLGPGLVSVILEPTPPHEVAELWADAHGLTARERDVARLAARGLTNAEIAGVLFLSPYTVQDYLKQVFTKTGVAGRTELAATLFAGADAPVPRRRIPGPTRPSREQGSRAPS